MSMTQVKCQPIAVVGMGCVFPKAPNVAAFWGQLLHGPTAISELSPREWQEEWYYSPDRSAPDRAYSKYAAVLDDVPFDFRKYRIPPKVAQDMHRTQLAFLEATSQALDDARQVMQACAPERVAFLLGSLGGGLRPDTRVRTRLLDMQMGLRESPAFQSLDPAVASRVEQAITEQLEREMAGVTEDEAIASFASVWVGRAAKIFDIRGPHMAVDAGYASTLAAIQVASSQLAFGDCDVALAGGSSQLLTPHDLVAFSKLGGLSDAHLTPFDKRANGTILGEGVAIFVLRRLEDAIRAGEKIYAVIRGIGAASDGKGKSLMAPNPKGQVLGMRRAYDQAGYRPQDVQYVECHATGTSLGDATEFASLCELFSGADVAPASIALGGVKELTGHLQAASGAAAMVKTLLALQEKYLPPQHSFREAAAGISFEGSPFYVVQEGKPWDIPAGGMRRASVSSFSFGGINYHLTLEEFSPAYHTDLVQRLAAEKLSAEPVAIVGLGGRFPKADDVSQLWENLLNKVVAIGEIPPERAEISRYLDPTRANKVRPYTNLAGYIVDGDWPQDAVMIPPKVASQIDRGQSWAMQAAIQTLADCNYSPDQTDPQRVGVVMGYLPPLEREFQTQARVYYAEFDGRLAAHLTACGIDAGMAKDIRAEAEEHYKRTLPPITEDTLLGYMGSLCSARVAHHLNFQGPAMMVESACGSTLAAVAVALNWLRSGTCDLVLAGGLYASLGVDALSQCCSFGGLSQRGSFPFDSRADGYITSEGAAVLGLKRLSLAEADGDRIYAVIRSVAGATDPRSASIWAPSSEGQIQAVRAAVTKAGIMPDTVQFIETHGTGTPVGDPVEVQSYQAVYGTANPSAKIALGAVKANLGHLNSGAGGVALIKTALSLYHKVMVPNVGFETPNPQIPWDDIPFRVPTERAPWESPPGGVRRAGVSSFGLGGTSFHAIVEEYTGPGTASRLSVRERLAPDLLPFLHLEGENRGEILHQLERLIDEAAVHPTMDLRTRLPDGKQPCRFAMSLTDGRANRSALDRARRILAATGSGSVPEQGIYFYDIRDPRQIHQGKVAALFPGQGPQYANMLRPLAEAYPVVKQTFIDGDEIFHQIGGRALSDTFWLPLGAEETYRQDDDTIHAAVFLANVALYRLIRSFGVRVDVVLGQSAGEYAALAAAGILPFDHALRAIYKRTLAVTRLPLESPGLMAIVSGDLESVKAMLAQAPGYVAVAAENGPGQGIVAGETNAVAYVVQWCRKNGVEVKILPVSHAYHSKVIAGAMPPFRNELKQLDWHNPHTPILSSVHGRYYEAPLDADFMARHLALQYVLPLQFMQHVLRLHKDGVRIFLESGPKWSLTSFVQATLSGEVHVAQASTHPKVGELEQFHRLLGMSYVFHALEGDRWH